MALHDRPSKAGRIAKPTPGKTERVIAQALAPIRTYASKEQKAQLPHVHLVLTPGSAGIEAMQEQYASHLHLLMAISALVLLIACANIANLLLVRGTARKAEMCVRTALGARRRKVARQLLTESMVLATLSGIAGLAVAYGGTRLLLALVSLGAKYSHPCRPVAGGAGVCHRTLTAHWFALRSGACMDSRADQPAEVLRSGTRSTPAELRCCNAAWLWCRPRCRWCCWWARHCSPAV